LDSGKKDQMTSSCAKNTDRELWREREDDYYAPSLHVTASGSVGINVGGRVVVRTLREWHAAAQAVPRNCQNPMHSSRCSRKHTAPSDAEILRAKRLA
jgi:hypothetical protein